MSDSGHPSRHGFVRCAWCGCWRRKDGVARVPWADGVNRIPERIGCRDTEWCRKAASSPVVIETAPKPNLDANGSPVVDGGVTTPTAPATKESA